MTVEFMKVGPYVVLRGLGSGGTAEIYEVNDPATGEHLALKMCADAGVDSQVFAREYAALSRLNHPSIVRVYYFGSYHHKPWFTMDLVSGLPSHEYIKSLGVPGAPERTKEVCRLGYLIAEALQYVHDRNLVHRDLKASNVMVLPDKRIKLVDFGTALLPEEREQEEKSGVFIGTYAYASPEQLCGFPIDGRSDLYSFGIMLYRLATGRRPFREEGPEALREAHLHGVVSDPRDLVPSIPEPLAVLILELLSKEPEDRPLSAKEVGDQLRNMLPEKMTQTTHRLALHRHRSVLRRRESRLFFEYFQMNQGVFIFGKLGGDHDRFLTSVLEELGHQGWAIGAVSLRGHDQWQSMVALLNHGLAGVGGGTLPSHWLNAQKDGDCISGDDVQALVRDFLDQLPENDASLLLVVRQLEQGTQAVLDTLSELHNQGSTHGLSLGIVCCGEQTRGPFITYKPDILPCFQSMSLSPLSPWAVATAVGRMLGDRHPPPHITQEICSITGGQPRYVEAIVQELVNSKCLAVMDGCVHWEEYAGTLQTPTGLESAMSKRMNALSKKEREWLDVLFIHTAPISDHIMRRVLDWKDSTYDAVVCGLLDLGLITLVGDNPACFGWAWPGMERIYPGTVDKEQEAQLSAACEKALADEPPSPARIRVALATGNSKAAQEGAIVWAEHRISQGEYGRAQKVLQDVIGQKSFDPAHSRGFLLQLLAHECDLAVHPLKSHSEEVLAQLAGIQGLPADRVLRLELAYARYYKVVGKYGKWVTQLESGLGSVSTETPKAISAELNDEMGRHLLWRGDYTGAEVAFKVTQAHAKTKELLYLQAQGEAGIARSLLCRGKLEEAESQATVALEKATQCGHVGVQCLSMAVLAHSLRMQGRYTEALEMLYGLLPTARFASARTGYVRLLLITGAIQADMLRIGCAQDCLEDLLGTIRVGEHLHLHMEAMILWGRILWLSGQPNVAKRVFEDLLGLANQAKWKAMIGHAQGLLTAVLLESIESAEAEPMVENLSRDLENSGDMMRWAEVCFAINRSLSDRVHPSKIFQPLMNALPNRDFLILEIEQEWGQWRYGKATRDPIGWGEASLRLDVLRAKLEGYLDPIDKEALRIHPWSQYMHKS